MKQKTRTVLIALFALAAILLIIFLLLYKPFSSTRKKNESQNGKAAQSLDFTDDIVLNSTRYEKTSFVYLKGGTVKGSSAFTTDTVPVTRGEADGAHVLLPSVFAANTVTTLSPFCIGRYEVTQELYTAVLSAQSSRAPNATPSYFVMDITGGENQRLRPVERVTWFDAVYFCNALSRLCGYDESYAIGDIVFDEKTNAITNATVTLNQNKNGFRLPSEAEWEYAARGAFYDKEAVHFTYAGSDDAHSVGWICTEGNYNIQGEGGSLLRTGLTHEVGLKKPNAAGIFDMTGNVQEWCFDKFDSIEEPPKRVKSKNPVEKDAYNPQFPSARVARGGSWYRVEGECTVTFRLPLKAGTPNTGCGIRLVRTPYKDEAR